MRNLTILVFYFSIILCLSCTAQNTKSNEDRLNEISTVNKIAFGSCNDEDNPQNYWSQISSLSPDLWIWMGDNIYGDSYDMEILSAKYSKQKRNLQYKQFYHSIPIIGTWDDHDYGINDGNKSYSMKSESKELMLNFLDVPENHPSRLREGAYQTYTLGDDHRVKIILLDTRSFQDPLLNDPSGKARYLKSQGDILGEAQWNWLESELANSLAEVNIIISSIQFLAKDHPYEKWANFPNSRNRMLDLLVKHSEQKVLFLSGDRHIAELSKLNKPILPYPLYDVTSSGLTHSYEGADEYNELRIGDIFGVKNFAVLNFDWQDNYVNVSLIIHSIDGKTLLKKELGKY